MDARRDARFVEEHVDEFFFARQVWVQALHRHEALEATHPGQARQIDGRHAARGDLAHQLVAIDSLSTRAGIKELGRHEPPQNLPVACRPPPSNEAKGVTATLGRVDLARAWGDACTAPLL